LENNKNQSYCQIYEPLSLLFGIEVQNTKKHVSYHVPGTFALFY
jgi:hypothetical protein